MSDANKAPGDPVEEPRPDGDVVDRANEALADAEAAQRDITPSTAADEEFTIDYDSHLDPDVAGIDEPAGYSAPAAPAESAAPAAAAATGAYAAPSADAYAPYPAPAADEALADDTATRAYADSAETTAYEPPAVTPSEPVASEPAVVAPAVAPAVAPQPIFVQAPEPPRVRGNRGAIAGIGLVAAVAFAVLYFGITVLIGFLQEPEVFQDDVIGTLQLIATRWTMWAPVVVFFIAFWLLGAFINRGRWGQWVIWGVLVGLATWGGFLLGHLLDAPFWLITGTEAAELMNAEMFTLNSFLALILGRELTIWFGAWAAARGRRVTELNEEARREYERTLEAGPQLVR